MERAPISGNGKRPVACAFGLEPRGPPSAPAGQPATREVRSPRSQKLPDQDVTEATTATVPEESGEAYEANPEAIDPPEPTIEGVDETTSEAADAPAADADASDDDEEQGQNELVVLDDL